MRSIRITTFLFLVAHLTTFSSTTLAQVVTSRASVLSILGPAAKNEDFTEFHAAQNTAYGIDFPVLDSTTVDQHQGPGLVQPGLRFSVAPLIPSGMQWSGPGSVSNAVLELSWNLESSSSTGAVAFTLMPTPAFGVDVIGISSININPHQNLTFKMFSPAGALLDTEQVITNGSTPVFFGFTSPTGIGSFTMTPTSAPFALFGITNLAYSPEPSGGAILVVGLFFSARFRRRHLPTVG